MTLTQIIGDRYAPGGEAGGRGGGNGGDLAGACRAKSTACKRSDRCRNNRL